MYVPDLAQSDISCPPEFTETYFSYPKELRLCYVGWLEAGHPLPTGYVDEQLLNKFARLCLRAVKRTRGYFYCDYCDFSLFYDYPPSVTVNGKTLYLGSAEIWIPYKDDIFFRSPNLMHHYMQVHKYAPPEVYLETLSKLKFPDE